MREQRVLVVISKELIGAGIKSICSREIGPLAAYILPRCEDAVRLASSGVEARLVLLEVDLVEKNKLPATIRELRRLFPSAGLMVAAANSSRNEVLEYLACGAHGVMLQDQSAKEIARAMELVMNGGIYIPPLSTGAMRSIAVPELALEAPRPGAPRAESRATGATAVAMPEGITLSARQAAVLRLLARGLSNKAIARELGLSEATVKVHTNAVFKALKVHNRASAVARVLSAEGSGFRDWGSEASRQPIV